MSSMVDKPIKCFYCKERDAVCQIITGINVLDFAKSTYNPVCLYCDTAIMGTLIRFVHDKQDVENINTTPFTKEL